MIWKNRGDKFIDKEQYDEAIKCYLHAIDKDPDYANAWHNLGYAYLKNGRPENAQECKERANSILAANKKERERIIQSATISPTIKNELPTDNITNETCLNCGAVLPYSQGQWPVGKPKLCPKCGVRVKDPIKYGSGAGQGRTHEEQLKNPTVAGLLSIFPGLGQLDNGQLGKGLIFLIGWSIGLFLYFVPSLIIWIYGIYDAHKTAKMMNYGDIPFKKMKGTHITVYFVTMVLIILIAMGGASNLPSGIPLPSSNDNTPSIPQIKEAAKVVPYEYLFRYNEQYIEHIVYFKGNVRYVRYLNGNRYNLLVATNGTYNDYIWVNYQGPRLLEDDTVEIWGKVKGLKTYTAIQGQSVTIPEIDSLHLQQVIV